MPTHHFICVDLARCSVLSKFRICFLEFSGIFFSNVFGLGLVDSMMQNLGMQRANCICTVLNCLAPSRCWRLFIVKFMVGEQ